MSMSCWIGMRRPLPTPGRPCDLPPSSSPPPAFSATAPTASFASPSFPPAFFSGSAGLGTEPFTSLRAPLTASGAIAPSPRPAATALLPDRTPLRRLRPTETFCSAFRAALPTASPSTSATSWVMVSSSHNPCPQVGYPPCAKENDPAPARLGRRALQLHERQVVRDVGLLERPLHRRWTLHEDQADADAHAVLPRRDQHAEDRRVDERG